MKKLYLAMCVCILVVTIMGVNQALSQVTVRAEIQTGFPMPTFRNQSQSNRAPRIRKDSFGLVSITIFSDPNLGFYAENIDPNTLQIATVMDMDPNTGSIVPDEDDFTEVQSLGSITLDINRDGESDLTMFYLARNLPLGDAEGETDVTVIGDYTYTNDFNEELIDTFSATDKIFVLRPFGFRFLSGFGWGRR